LEIETGRWYNIPKDERFCTLCEQSIGDECHLLFVYLVLWSILGLSQWVYVRDDMSKGLKIMSLGVINHGMSLSVLYIQYYMAK
jgi:hypothetical protein